MKRLICFLILLGSFWVNQTVFADGNQVSTFTLIHDVYAAAVNDPFGNYLNYHVEGQCLWMYMTPYGPQYQRTSKVSEFLPDTVVSVYTKSGDNPWLYANTIIDPVLQKMGNVISHTVGGPTPKNTDIDQNVMLKYRNVDIIGDPALAAVYHAIPFPMIKSVADEYEPYYSSLLDVYLWRDPYFEDLIHPEYLLPGVRDEGNFFNNWGGIYPRIGFINQPGDYKAAAVLTLRAADIATNPFQPRVYNYLESRSCGQDCRIWPSHENDFKNVKYQEIYPHETTSAKKTFGVMNYSVLGTYKQGQYQKGKGNYIFVMWRHYEGCIQGKGKLVGVISW